MVTHTATAKSPIDPAVDIADPADDDDPLAPHHRQQLAAARINRRRIERAAVVARLSAWTTAVLAAVTLMGTLFSVTALILGAALAVVAYHEFKGLGLLRQLDGKAMTVLGYNQLGLGLIVVIYSLWNIWAAWMGPSPIPEDLRQNQELARMFGSIDELHRVIAVIFYGTIIALSVVAQGLMARYYFSRARYLQTFLRRTPRWIVDLHKQMAR